MTCSTRPPSTSTCRPLCARGSQAGRAGASAGTAAHTLESVDCTLAYEHRCVCPANAGEYSCCGRGLWFRYQVLNGSPMLWSTIVATVVAMFFMDLYQAPLCLQPPIGGRGMLYAIRHRCMLYATKLPCGCSSWINTRPRSLPDLLRRVAPTLCIEDSRPLIV